MAGRSRSSAVFWLAMLIAALVIGVVAVGYSVMRRQAAARAPIDVDISLPRPPSLPHAPKLPDPPLPRPK